MNIEELWRLAVEEFRERAHERFIGTIYDIESNGDAFKHGIQRLQLKPIHDLIAHDIEVYGDKAYLMWTNTANRIIEDNEELIYLYDCLRHGIGEELARKTTAALPFDFGRAKAGDAVEHFRYGSWFALNVDFTKAELHLDMLVVQEGYYPINTKYLRMKYPPKAISRFCIVQILHSAF